MLVSATDISQTLLPQRRFVCIEIFTVSQIIGPFNFQTSMHGRLQVEPNIFVGNPVHILLLNFIWGQSRTKSMRRAASAESWVRCGKGVPSQPSMAVWEHLELAQRGTGGTMAGKAFWRILKATVSK